MDGPITLPALWRSHLFPRRTGTVGPACFICQHLQFLPSEAQQALSPGGRGLTGLPDTVPYYEVAHQWWGAIVGWSDYRDQWIDEGLASYIALAGADAEQSQRARARFLARTSCRTELTTKVPGRDALQDDAGPLVLGYRLELSRAPGAYDAIISGKGAWVFHMLRMMLRDPGAGNPDERFLRLLHSLVEDYSRKALTTDDLQHEIERIMTPAMALEGGHSMDWFFDQWVRATGIPRYAAQFTSQPDGRKSFLCAGRSDNPECRRVFSPACRSMLRMPTENPSCSETWSPRATKRSSTSLRPFNRDISS